MRRLFEAADFARLLDEPSEYLPGSIAFEFRNVDSAPRGCGCADRANACRPPKTGTARLCQAGHIQPVAAVRRATGCSARADRWLLVTRRRLDKNAAQDPAH